MSVSVSVNLGGWITVFDGDISTSAGLAERTSLLESPLSITAWAWIATSIDDKMAPIC